MAALALMVTVRERVAESGRQDDEGPQRQVTISQ